jgi:hypothetical protein
MYFALAAPPQVHKLNKVEILWEGDTLTLACDTLTTYPTPTLYWEKGQQMLNTADSRLSLKSVKLTGHIVSSSFRLVNLTLADTGWYTCVATNVYVITNTDRYLPNVNLERPLPTYFYRSIGYTSPPNC